MRHAIRHSSFFMEEGLVGGGFLVVIDGIPIGAFTEVSGLEVTMDVYEHNEGGANSFTHKLPGRTSFPNIVLKRGITRTDQLFTWMRLVGNGRGDVRSIAARDGRYIVRRSLGAILLMGANTRPLRMWAFEGAIPVKWTGPTFAAATDAMPEESLEIAHTGFYSTLFAGADLA